MQKFTFFFSPKESVTSPGEFNLRITSSPSYEFLKEEEEKMGRVFFLATTGRKLFGFDDVSRFFKRSRHFSHDFFHRERLLASFVTPRNINPFSLSLSTPFFQKKDDDDGSKFAFWRKKLFRRWNGKLLEFFLKKSLHSTTRVDIVQWETSKRYYRALKNTSQRNRQPFLCCSTV